MLPADPLCSPAARRWTILALLIGVLLTVAMWIGQDAKTLPQLSQTLGPLRWTLILLIAGLAMIPAVRQRLAKLAEKLANPSPRQRRRTALIVAIVAFMYLTATALLQNRDLFPKTHDEQSYFLQMRMLASFRLWMPQHPLADFFDSFYVIVRPVYASFYFPGASLLYVPTIWLGLPTWIMPSLVASAIVAMVYLIVSEIADGMAALLVALGMLSLEFFRVYSILLTSHEPALLFALLLVWAWLRWRETYALKWAILMGVFAGWGAITRPVDALCYAIPVGVAIVLDVFRRGTSADKPDGRRSLVFAKTAALIVLGAAPFLALQAVFDLGVSGRLLETPFDSYLHRDQPNTSFGFHPFDPSVRPKSIVPQKQYFYDVFYVPRILWHQPSQLLPTWGRNYGPLAADSALPSRLLLVFIPLGVLTVLKDRRKAILCSTLLLFVLLYMGYTIFLEHYTILIMPAALLLSLFGMRRVATILGPKFQPMLRTGLTACFAAICVLSLPEFNPLWGQSYEKWDETFPDAPLMHFCRIDLPQAADVRDRRVIVLVKWLPHEGLWRNFQEEPVYNTQTAWPDDSPIIFAHDLGDERNQALFRYYAERQPDRFVYRLDRTGSKAEGLISELGPVKDLVR